MRLAWVAHFFMHEEGKEWEYYCQEVVKMVKGISRQVIVVHAPDPKFFEQAIFILNENAVETGGVTDEMLLREAKKLIRFPEQRKNVRKAVFRLFWAVCGAGAMALVWLLTAIL